jgi:acyl carrier protein
LLRALHTGVQLRNASAESSIADLQQAIDKQIAMEKELVVDPAFFNTLQQALPGITRVEIQLKRGCHENELTKFRYDVILHLGKQRQAEADGHTLNWGSELSTLNEVRHLLRTSQPELLTLKDVPNARVSAAVEIVEALAGKPGTMKVDAFNKLTAGSNASRGVDPETLWALEQEFPYSIEVTWSEAGSVDTFDSIFRHRDRPLREVPSEVVREREPNWNRFANQPVQGELARDLSPMMRGFLAERLPEHMIPQTIMEWRELPLTANGKVDRAALSASSISKLRSPGTPFVPAATPLEVNLANIWSEVLRIERIGITDNFFVLGGHSLLATQVVSRVRDRLGVNLPLRSLFKAPTVSGLAREVLELRLQSHTAWEVPITKSAPDRQTLLPEQLDQLSENEIDALLYRVLADADQRDE